MEDNKIQINIKEDEPVIDGVVEENIVKQTKNQEDYGTLFHSWNFKEYEHHERKLSWYIFFGIIFGGASIWAILDKNYLFFLIILIFVFLQLSFKNKEPKEITFSIYEDGVVLGEAFSSWESIKEFFIIYEPKDGIKKLNLVFNKLTLGSASIDLEDQNPVLVRETLLRYAKEDLERKAEPLTHQLSRIFKL